MLHDTAVFVGGYNIYIFQKSFFMPLPFLDSTVAKINCDACPVSEKC